jgi:uncharacterized membrane protein YgdD (TMEM256/DUF423 family)
MTRYFLSIGAALAGIAVMAGAFGAHMLEDMVSIERLATFETGVQYQIYHALALVLIGWISRTSPVSYNAVGYCFLAGIVIFSGSLYVLVLTDTPWLGAITPLGGLAFIAGWIILAYKGIDPSNS